MPSLQLGLSYPRTCSYLPQQQEQLVFLLPEQPVTAELYQQLLHYNFRRSGDQVYRPYCPSCTACQSVRLESQHFLPSASQRRLLNRATRAGWQYKLVTPAPAAQYFPLYAEYIGYKHQDSEMYPPEEEQLAGMLQCRWLQVQCLEQYYQQQLVAVTIIDELTEGYSAVYTFFSPNHRRFSPGALAILYLHQLAVINRKDYIYLGYYVSECLKMAYKADFRPQQRLIGEQWHSFA